MSETPVHPADVDDLQRDDSSRLLRDALPFLRQDAWLYVFAVLLAPFTAAMIMIEPMIMRAAIDDHILPGDLPGALELAWWYLLVVIAGFVFNTAHTLALSYAAMRTITRLRETVYTHTITRAQSFFDGQPTGRLLTRATSDVQALGETLSAGAVTILLDVLQVTGVLLAMFWLDPGLTAVLLLVGPPLAFAVDWLRRILRGLYQAVRTSLSELNAYLSERLDGVETVQLYADEERTMRGFDARLDRYRDATVRTNIFDSLLYAMVDGVGSVTMALMLWYGSGGLLDGAVTAGVLAAFIDYVGKLFRPIQEFSAKVAVIQRAMAALSKIFGLLDVQETIEGGDATLPAPAEGRVLLQDVHFAYDDGNDVIAGIDIDMAPGEVVALVGRTGSGKTTIGKLLTRAYTGFRGQILLDGVPVQDLPVDVVRRTIGSVQQDVQLFPGSVRFNLTLGAEHSDADIAEALRLAHAEGVVERLGGLDGHIEEGGRNLSGGEAQLLSFARTLLADPPVVVLDEATASVDSLTEAKLQDATRAVLERTTTLVIAHRLSTIMDADRIVVLDHGRILESGRHDELMAHDGAYASLFREQFAEPEAAAS